MSSFINFDHPLTKRCHFCKGFFKKTQERAIYGWNLALQCRSCPLFILVPRGLNKHGIKSITYNGIIIYDMGIMGEPSLSVCLRGSQLMLGYIDDRRIDRKEVLRWEKIALLS